MSIKKSIDVEVTLSAKGLRNLPKNVYEHDFTFIVCENRYDCPSFLASFVSPRICSLQKKDVTLQEFYIETEDPTDLFKTIIEVCYGSSFRVKDNLSFYRSIFCELGNRELYEQVFGQFDEDLTILNVLDRLLFLFSTDESCDIEIDIEIEFCSSHFYEFPSKSIFSLPFEIISLIISRNSLQLQDEESLYEMIISRQNEDSRFFSLFEYVRFEYLSSKSMKSFIEMINESFDFLTFPIWRSLCHRLSLSVLNVSNVSNISNISNESLCDRFVKKYSSIVCSFGAIEDLNGIISYLTKRFGGHVIDRDIVSITASGFYDAQSYPLRNVADFENRSLFITNNIANSWICYDFKDMRIKLTQYSIRARLDGYPGEHLRFWTLEGSKDGLTWIEIDDRKNDTSLNSKGMISTFLISIRYDEGFRMIRLRQTGKDSNGVDYLTLSAIEFFGVLEMPRQ
jgi:hypothetical protein